MARKLLLAAICTITMAMLLDRLVGLFVPAVSVQVAHPANFHERRKNLEFEVDFRTNSQGLRYREIPLAKESPNEFRAVVLGDSMTEGWGVEADETFSAVLEKDFTNRERPAYFINGGLTGKGPLEYGRVLAVVGLKYRPDLVLVALHANDLTDTPEGATLDVVKKRHGRYAVREPELRWEPTGWLKKTAFRVAPWTYIRLQGLALVAESRFTEQRGVVDRVKEQARRTGVPDSTIRAWEARVPPDVVEVCDRGEFNEGLLAAGCLRPDVMLKNLDVAGEAAERQWVSMRNVMNEIVKLSQGEGAKVAVVYAPSAFQYDETIGGVTKKVGVHFRRGWLTEETSELERRLVRWAAEAGVPFLSLTHTFRVAAANSPGKFAYALDEHWTAAGHKLAGETIAKWLREQGLGQARVRMLEGLTLHASRSERRSP